VFAQGVVQVCSLQCSGASSCAELADADAVATAAIPAAALAVGLDGDFSACELPTVYIIGSSRVDAAWVEASA
jgi:hypothetical protein